MKSVYEKIEEVLEVAGRAIAAHEFDDVEVCDYPRMTGRFYVGCSESALSRRLREMRELGRVTAKRREGKAFVEYSLAVREPVAA